MSGRPTHVFLLPHQDDEFGVFHRIETLVANGERAVCLFLTDGGWGGQDSNRRNRESEKVLKALGLGREDIVFIGTEHAIPDGDLVTHLTRVFEIVAPIVAALHPIDTLYVPAWEGGHQDHDAAYALGLTLAAAQPTTPQVLQFALYNRYSGWPFGVLSPLPQNGPTQRFEIPWRRRLAYLAFCLSYRSQAKTWLALLPLASAHYLFNGVQELQQADRARLSQRPHDTALLYESRKRMTFDDFSNRLDAFLDKYKDEHRRD